MSCLKGCQITWLIGFKDKGLCSLYLRTSQEIGVVERRAVVACVGKVDHWCITRAVEADQEGKGEDLYDVSISESVRMMAVVYIDILIYAYGQPVTTASEALLTLAVMGQTLLDVRPRGKGVLTCVVSVLMDDRAAECLPQ